MAALTADQTIAFAALTGVCTASLVWLLASYVCDRILGDRS